nr:carbohydrate ABC transporter permease [Clostridia bacterium]
MIQDNGLGIRAFRIVNGIVMLILLFLCAYPIYFVLVASVSDGRALVKNIGALWAPLKPYTLGAYQRVLSNRNILTGYRNTAFVLVAGVSLNLVMTVIGAYFLSLKRIRLGGAIMFLILFTRYFSGGLVPDFLNIKSLGLLDSLWSLIL